MLVPEDALPRIAADGILEGAYDGVQEAQGAPAGSPTSGPLADGVFSAGEPAGEVARATARAEVVAEWLTSMGSVSAPLGLDGLVVAAMNPGQRQVRATQALSGLERLTAPEALTAFVAGQILRTEPQERASAPPELDRLVEDRVARPEETLIEGMTGRLGPVAAPAELDARLDGSQPESRARSGSQTPGSDRVRRVPGPRLLTSLALAAAVVIASVGVSSWSSSWGGFFSGSAPGEGPGQGTGRTAVASVDGERILTAASGARFRVVQVTPDSMTAGDRAVIGALGIPMGGS